MTETPTVTPNAFQGSDVERIDLVALTAIPRADRPAGGTTATMVRTTSGRSS